MDRSENNTSEVEEESQSLNEEKEKEIETGLLHFRDEMIDFWEKETSTARKNNSSKTKETQ